MPSWIGATARFTVAQYARLHAYGQWEVFHPDITEPLSDTVTVLAKPGDVLRFCPSGTKPPPRNTFDDLLGDPLLWNASPVYIPRESASSRWYAMRSHVTRTPQYAGTSRQEVQGIAAEAFDSEATDLVFAYPLPNSALHELVHQGFSIRGVLAATIKSASGGSHGIVAFIDSRPLSGFTVFAQGTPGQDREVHIFDQCTIVLSLAPSDTVSLPHRCLSAPPKHHDTPPVAPANDHAGHEVDVHGPTVFNRENIVQHDPTVLLGLEEPDEEEPEHENIINAGFMIFVPRFIPETVYVALQAPCNLDRALGDVDHARQSHTSVHFDRLIPAVPQPDPSFGAVLAVPSWANHLSFVLIDTRRLDGRLFALEIRGRLNRSSLLQQVGVNDDGEVDVFLHGRALDAVNWFQFLSGDVVQLLPRDCLPPPPTALADMLRGPEGWTYPCPCFDGPAEVAFLVLTDGGHRVVPVDTDAIQSSRAFKAEVSKIVGYSYDNVTVCPAMPRIEDLAVGGQRCKTALVATEKLVKIPIPPGRMCLKQTIALLDARLLLRDVSWSLAPQGYADIHDLAAPYQYIAPTGLFVSITGAPIECHRDRNFLRISNGTLLRLVHVHDEVAGGDSSSESSASRSASLLTIGESDESSDIGNPVPDVPIAEPHNSPNPDRLRRSRSRSPVARAVPNGTWVGGLGLAYVALSSQVMQVDAFQDNSSTELPGLTVVSCHGGFCRLSLFHWIGMQGLVFGSWGLFLIGILHRSFDTKHAFFADPPCPRAHKILQEPTGSTPAEQSHLDTLRSIANALGGPWLPRLPHDLQHLLQDSDDESDQDDTDDTLAQVTCSVLAPDFAPAWYSIEIHMPATTEEVVTALQLLRPERMRSQLPNLVPVLPQPRATVATFISVPTWSLKDQWVCFDCTRVDHRLYCTRVPEYVTLQRLLDIADFPPTLHITVWAGTDQHLLGPDEVVHTFPGMLFCFLHDGEEPQIPITLGQLLQFRSWNSPGELPEPRTIHAYCLVYDRHAQLFISDPYLPARHRQHIAIATGADLTRMRLYAGSPRPVDAATNGVVCKTILAVGDRHRSLVQPAWHLALLDCRLIGLSWRTVTVEGGTFNIGQVLEDLDHHAPHGWHTVLLEDRRQIGRIEARPGQIFSLVFSPGDSHTRLAAAESVGRGTSGEDTSENHSGPGYETGREEPSSIHARSDQRQVRPQERASGSDSGPVHAYASQQDQALDRDTPVPFLVFSQEYWPELVVVRLALPTGVQDAIAAVEQARDAVDHRGCSRLIPVFPQSRERQACLIAVPSWPFEGIAVLVDNRVASGGVFAVLLPRATSREALLRIAGLPDDSSHDVYLRDTPWPCTNEQVVYLSQGDLILICSSPRRPDLFDGLDQFLRVEPQMGPLSIPSR